MDSALLPRRTKGLAWCLKDEGGLIFDKTGTRTWSINPLGLFIWDRCDGSRDVARIIREMSEHFEVDEAKARADLVDFLENMQALGLIELGSPVTV